MIPLRGARLSGYRPYVTWTIAATCAAALVRLAMLPDPRATAILQALSLIPARWLAAPVDPGQLATLITSTLLHAGWVHLLGNMVFLIVFGPLVESRLGHLRFLGLYIACGVAGGAAHVLVNPESTVPLVGASGAIAGVLGAHLVLAPRERITTIIPVIIFIEIAALPSAFLIGFWFLLQLASALAPATAAQLAPVAWYAHLAGFGVGVALAVPSALGKNSGRTTKRRPQGRRRSNVKSRKAA